MDVQLPNLKGKEKNTLYVIGNGFDLFHEVKTKFIHFYSWLNLKDDEHESFAAEMENFFQSHGVHGNQLWRDFEKALGDIDINYIQKQYSGVEDNVYFDENFHQRAAQRLHRVANKIPFYLREWIKATDCSNVEPKMSLSKESLYLSFNYTLLLENVYHIPKSQIVHIHHCYMDKEDLITGHNKGFPQWPDYPSNFNIEKALQNISAEANALRKPVQDVIKQHSNFFISLSNISNIIVFGHSLSAIDRPYFEEVLRHVHNDAHWYFVCYDDNVKYMYQEIVEGQAYYGKKIIPANCKYINISK